jgi:hypothetical protein
MRAALSTIGAKSVDRLSGTTAIVDKRARADGRSARSVVVRSGRRGAVIAAPRDAACGVLERTSALALGSRAWRNASER